MHTHRTSNELIESMIKSHSPISSFESIDMNVADKSCNSSKTFPKRQNMQKDRLRQKFLLTNGHILAFKNAYHYENMINDTGFWSKTSEIHHGFYNYSDSFDIGFYFGHNDHLDNCI